MKLVIAEKPSVAQDLARVLGACQRKDGYCEGKKYLVSWCYGHLAGLADAGTYDERYTKWKLEDLPILPSPFRFLIAPDKQEQFDILRALMNREDVTEVINACDAGREGDGADLRLTEDSPSEQFSFFPTEAQQIESVAEAERVQTAHSAFSMFISQADIDHILRTGGNEDDARMKIVAEFSKQKPLEDRAAFLKALYHGGNGLVTENGKISAWYSEDGIHIASGNTARYLPSAQVISWADAAERTEELLDSGTFAANLWQSMIWIVPGVPVIWHSERAASNVREI